MPSVTKIEKTLKLLQEYNGNNPSILTIKKSVVVMGGAINDATVEYVTKNINVEPKEINKVVEIAEWYGETMKEKLNLDFVPKKIKILKYFGETSAKYCLYIQYRQSVEPAIKYIPKEAILRDFLVEDYTKVQVDFERYDRLSNYQRILLDHQKEGVKFLLSRKKCVLADSQGLGKTTELVVAAIEGNFDSILIICPASLKENWRRELLFYVPERDITIIESFSDKTKPQLEEFLGYAPGKSNMKRDELLEEAKKRGQWKFNRFVIINYDILDNFFQLKRTYTQEQFDNMLSNSPLLQFIYNKKALIIVDEAHELSNSKSIRYKTIKGLINKGKPHSVWLATGTPITNNPINFFCVLNLIEDNITGRWDYYMKRYCGAIEICKEKDKRQKISSEYIASKKKRTWYDLTDDEKKELSDIVHKQCKHVLIDKEPTNLDELSSRVAHMYLRRTKDILTLPEKRVHEVYYDLTPSQQEEYDRLWADYEAEKKKDNPDKELNKELIEGGIYRQYLSLQMIPNTIKLANSFTVKGEKVVIACCYDEELYKLQEYYRDRCVIYNGKMSLKQKEEAIRKFTTDGTIKVFVGNIIAAGVGITLISACKLIFNDFSYVTGDNLQMSDRIHRIGQKRDVDIYYQIFNNTQYARMWEITIRKQILIDSVIKREDEKQ